MPIKTLQSPKINVVAPVQNTAVSRSAVLYSVRSKETLRGQNAVDRRQASQDAG